MPNISVHYPLFNFVIYAFGRINDQLCSNVRQETSDIVFDVIWMIEYNKIVIADFYLHFFEASLFFIMSIYNVVQVAAAGARY